MKILSNKEYERIINKKTQFYTYYTKDPYQAKKIEELEIQNIRLEIESDKKDKEIERLNGALQTHEILLKSNLLEIERLNKGYCKFKEQCGKYATCLRENQLKEIERLNNIINELEKYLIEEIEDYNKHINSQYITDIARGQYEGEKVCFEDMLGKLQELKGSSNNE